MEKRNFVTTLRTAESGDIGDELVKSASDLFGETKHRTDEFEKSASAEDEKSDRL